MLAGTYDVQLDDAGRLTVPSRLRAELGDEVMVTTALPPNKHLLLFAAPSFEDYIRELFPAPTIDLGQVSLKRLLLGNAFALKLDKAGRILIPPALRELAGLGGPARVVGMDHCAEIWSAAAHDEWLRAVNSPEMMMRTLEALQGLGARQMERQRSAG
ncbi:MAG: cell division/cell wall cluster transcriptional repressor MraZ [Armatimonadetes bacterium]|nr:cell division/cell wall cluster transcriptional repressor MraZ [Armatimonadota bacterium]